MIRCPGEMVLGGAGAAKRRRSGKAKIGSGFGSPVSGRHLVSNTVQYTRTSVCHL